MPFLAAFFDELPLPAWIKTADCFGNISMARVNKAYTASFGLSTEDIASREKEGTLEEMFEWTRNDKEAILKNDMVTVVEKVTLKGEDKPRICVVHKWPVVVGVGTIICGVAVPVGGNRRA